MIDTPASPVSAFITRWKASGASERANYQLFLSELCELLGVEKPRPAPAAPPRPEATPTWPWCCKTWVNTLRP